MDPFKPYVPKAKPVPMHLSRNDAEIVALRALQFIGADAKVFSRFIGVTGLDLATIRQRAAEPSLLIAVLDFLLADERTVMAFTTEVGLAPEAPLLARQLLAGPSESP